MEFWEKAKFNLNKWYIEYIVLPEHPVLGLSVFGVACFLVGAIFF